MLNDLITYLTCPITPVLQEINCGSTEHVRGFGKIDKYSCSIVSLDGGNSYRSVGGIDLLAMRELQHNPLISTDLAYSKAVSWIRRSVLQIETQPAFQEEETLGRLARLHRRLFDLVNFPYLQDPTESTERLGLEQLLHNRGIDTSSPFSGIGTLSAAGVVLLKRLLAALGYEKPIRTLNAAVVIPWYIQPSVLGGVSIYTDGLVKVVDVGILPAPLYYTQLSSIRKGSLQVFPDVETSCRMGSRKPSAQGLACSVSAWGLSGVSPWVSEEGAYLIYDKESLLQQVLSAKRLAQFNCTSRLVELTEYLTPDKPTGSSSVVDILLRKAVELSEKDPGLVPELEALLEAAGPPADLKAQISAKLRSLNRLKTLGELNQRFQDGLLTKEDKYEIQITQSGYLYRDLKDNETTQLTNHTCQLISQIIYPGIAERYIQVNFSVQDKDHSLTIPESAFENSKKLAGYLLTYETTETEPPRILDTDKHKYALNWFKLRIPRLPVKAGLSFVGWDSQSSRFFAPDFQVDSQGIHDGELPIHPSNKELQVFSPWATAPVFCPDLPKELCNLISMCLALLNRGFAGYSMKPVEVYNNLNNRKVLQEVFRGLGQVRPLDINQNPRANAPGCIKGYPYYTLGMTDLQVKNSNHPVVNLGDKGLSFPECTEEELSKAAGTLAYLSRRLTEALCKGVVWIGEPAQRILYTSALIDEGAEIARQSGNLLSWPQADTQFPLVEKALRSIPQYRMSEYLLFAFEEQKIHFRDSLLSQDIQKTRQELAGEFSRLVKKVSLQDSYIALSGDGDTQKLLQDFFGKPIDYGQVVTGTLAELLAVPEQEAVG